MKNKSCFLIFFICLFGWCAFAQTNSATPVITGRSATGSTFDPATVQSQFNAWSAVLLVIGGVIWHALLKAWGPLKAAYPYVVAQRGIIVIICRFFYQRPPKPPTT